MIPETIRDGVFKALREAGDTTPIHELRASPRGGVSDTMRLLTDRDDYFLKRSEGYPLINPLNGGAELLRLDDSRPGPVPVWWGIASRGVGDLPAPDREGQTRRKTGTQS